MTNIDLNILLQNCRLFNNMSIDNVKSLITCSKAILKKYKKYYLKLLKNNKNNK